MLLSKPTKGMQTLDWSGLFFPMLFLQKWRNGKLSYSFPMVHSYKTNGSLKPIPTPVLFLCNSFETNKPSVMILITALQTTIPDSISSTCISMKFNNL